jgi:hypothetical protein
MSIGMETQNTVDEKFNQAKANFDQLTFFIDNMKTKLESQISHLNGVRTQSDLFVGDFVSLYSTSQNHSLIPFANECQLSESTLFKQTDPLVKQLENGPLRKLQNLMDLFAQYKERIKQREQFREDFDYYSAKAKKAQSERDKTLSSGKKEGPKDMESRQKAEHKLEIATKSYGEINSNLINELTKLWTTRHDLLGNVLTEFMAVEKAAANLQHTTLQSLKIPNPSAIDLKTLTPSPSPPPMNPSTSSSSSSSSSGKSGGMFSNLLGSSSSSSSSTTS